MGAIVRCVILVLAAAAAGPAQKKIAVERISLHQIEDGPVLPDNYEFVPGETGFLSCRLNGYQIQKKDEEQSVKLSWSVRVVDPQGVPIEPEKSGSIDEKVLPQDKNWIPKFLSHFTVPSFAPTGAYRVSVTVKDEIGGTGVAAEIGFRVRGHDVEPSNVLVTRNFEFLRSEHDRTGMPAAVYHPGEMLWARFDITGFKFAQGNRFSVEYGLAVLRGAGEQLFSQPVAAAESKESFYPQRYVPGMLSLTLDQTVAKGAYVLVVIVRDQIGNQTWDSRQPFQVQ